MDVDILDVRSREEQRGCGVLFPTSTDMIQFMHAREGERGKVWHIEV